MTSAEGTVSQTVRAPTLRTHHCGQKPGHGFPMCVTSLTLAFVSFYCQLPKPLKVLLQCLACIHNFQNNSILLQILPLTSSCQKICVWKRRDFCWITSGACWLFPRKHSLWKREIHCKRAVSTLPQYVIFIHLFPNDASFLLRMPIFVHLQRTDVSFISLGLPGCLPGSNSGATVATFQSSRPLLYPEPGDGSAITQQMRHPRGPCCAAQWGGCGLLPGRKGAGTQALQSSCKRLLFEAVEEEAGDLRSCRLPCWHQGKEWTQHLTQVTHGQVQLQPPHYLG